MDVIALFVSVDDFCIAFEPGYEMYLLTSGARQRVRKSHLCLSEVMTIVIGFHMSGYRTFRDYYLKEVCAHQRWAFPRLVSYNRFVELMPRALVPLCHYLHSRKGTCNGVAFIDSTPLTVCHNRRIRSHQVFADVAARGKNSMGWFYGFKLHLVVNDMGELLAFQFTPPGNVDDRKPVPDLVEGMYGKLFGDKGYISQPLFEQLYEQGVQLITDVRKNMKNKLVPLFDKLMLRKRSIIETINDQLKNISQIEHHRHRSGVNFMVNAVAGLIAYTHREKKPSLRVRLEDYGHQAILDI